MLFSPFGGVFEMLRNRALVPVDSEPFFTEPCLGAIDPLRTLMREFIRLVVMEADNDIAVAFGQLERSKPPDAVVVGWAYYDSPFRITLANDFEHFLYELVPGIGVEGALRLIKRLEQYRIGSVLVVGRNLFPECEESFFVRCRVDKELVVMVHIDHYWKVSRQTIINGPIDPFEKVGVDSIRGFFKGVSRPADGQANGIEAGLFDKVEILLL